MKTIGIVGLGFVGMALAKGMKHAFDIIGYDIKDGFLRSQKGDEVCHRVVMKDWLDEPYDVLLTRTDGPIFVCVPTPMNKDGSCNVTIVSGVVNQISEAAQRVGRTGVVVTIKSTVVPGTTLKLNQQYDNIFVTFNPEFLTERNAIEDFKNQDRIIVGGPHEGTAILKQIYETAFPNVPVTKTSSTIAELVKYTTNCFLATKVSFANEMKQVCDKLEVDYDKVIEYATKDKRLGTSHWSTPGPDGKKGFGGSCFVKDLNALVNVADKMGVDTKTMKGAWEKNLEVRPERDWESLKGRAVTE
jgi:nucleotide sugar dehydrogenase